MPTYRVKINNPRRNTRIPNVPRDTSMLTQTQHTRLKARMNAAVKKLQPLMKREQSSLAKFRKGLSPQGKEALDGLVMGLLKPSSSNNRAAVLDTRISEIRRLCSLKEGKLIDEWLAEEANRAFDASKGY